MKGSLRHATDVTKRDMYNRTVPDGGSGRGRQSTNLGGRDLEGERSPTRATGE
jgi:hypothetical protein